MRLIDADALRKQLDFGKTGTEEFDKGYDIGIQNAIEMLDNAPTVEERPTGEWILHGMIYYCSKCGHECGESGDNFCGNCGAKMKGGAEQ